MIDILVLQRVIPSYRINLFRSLKSQFGFNFLIACGDDKGLGEKVKNSIDASSIIDKKFNTIFIRFFGYRFPLWIDLIPYVLSKKPKLVICEGDSNILNNIQIFLVKLLIPNIVICHWSLGGMPGDVKRSSVAKYLSKAFFDYFFVYSTFGACELRKIIKYKSIFIVKNFSGNAVEFTESIDARDAAGNENSSELRCLFVGSLEPDKDIDLLVRVAACLKNHVNFTIIGDGSDAKRLRKFCEKENVSNIKFLGSLRHDECFAYYRNSDVFFLPGRGGMVISEALSHGLPVLCINADGIEFDLIQNGSNGFILPSNEAIIKKILLKIHQDRDLLYQLKYKASYSFDETPFLKTSGDFLKAVKLIAKEREL